MTAPFPLGTHGPAQSRPLTALLEGLPLVTLPLAPTIAHAIIPSKAYTVALIGAGGKTTLLYALARELVRAGLTVITSTTTHIFPPTPAESPLYLLTPTPAALQEALSQHKHVTVAEKTVTKPWPNRAQERARLGRKQNTSQIKLAGFSAEAPASIASLRNAADVLLVEADGAAMRPLKAPAEHEPAVPPCTDMCIALCGLGGVGHPLQDSVHRPERASTLCATFPHHKVRPEHLAHLSLHPQGLFRTTPPTAHRAVLCILPKGMPHTAGLPLARQAAHAARQLYPAHNSAWWAGSPREGWVIEVAPALCPHLPMDRHCIPL